MIVFRCVMYCLVFLAYTAIGSESLELSTLYLTWQRDPSQTITMQWISQSSDPKPVTIQYQPQSESLWETQTVEPLIIPLQASYFLYRVELTELKPDLIYRFKIDPRPEVFQFRTMPAQAKNPIHFVTGGDMYHDTIQYMIETCQQAAKTNPHFAVLGGDIAYAFGKIAFLNRFNRWIDWVQAWHRTMVTPDGLLIPVISVIGNHDLAGQYDQTPLQARLFAAFFPMPGPPIYNVLDFGDYLSLILLDSGHANAIRGEQQTWLEDVLSQRQEVLHKMAFYHVPAYPSVRSFYQTNSIAIRKYWVPIFEKYQLQVAFEHHDHAYKRTYPLLNHKPHPEGILYLGDGAWGIKNPRRPKSTRKLSYVAKTASIRHFIVVTLYKDQEFFTILDAQGRLVDQYTQSALKNQSVFSFEPVK